MESYLLAEKAFERVEIFEQRAHVGGLWAYTPETTGDGLCEVPQTAATRANLECAVKGDSGREDVFLSPIYDQLETNIPKSLMSFSDTPFDANLPLFPRHEGVQRYLEEYGSAISSHIQLQTQVLDIKFEGRSSDGQQDQWDVSFKHIPSGKIRMQTFNAIVVATGHFSTPSIPKIPGLAEWDRQHPNSISHSKYFRLPHVFANKKVVVVGNSASGLDIASQIANICKPPLLLSQRSVSYLAGGFATSLNTESVSQIVGVDSTTRTVIFADGREEADVDSILFCTGYLYTLPFLRSLRPQPVGDGTRLEHTFQHLFYAPRPSLAFMVLPQKIIPFPLAEAQAALLARIWSGRLTLPGRPEMEDWERSVIAERGKGGNFHTLKFPEDAEYINMLYDWAASAENREDLENNGIGKLPRRWGAWEYWARENFPAIRKAFVSRGQARTEVKSLDDLGFTFKD